MTTQNVRDRVANIFFLSIIIAWLFMSYWAYYSQPVQAQHPDTNLISNKPAPYRRLNSNGYSQKYIELSWATRDERAISLLEAYWFDKETWNTIKVIARIHKVYPEMILAIAYADSSMWKFLRGKNNFGNYAHYDSVNNHVDFDTMEAWFNAIGVALTNRYLWKYTTVDQLSRRGNKTGMVYATSTENRHINCMNFLSMVYDKKVSDQWKFRR